jgi:Domain of unknown function (DUF4124)
MSCRSRFPCGRSPRATVIATMIITCAAALVPRCWADDMYKTVDAQGNVAYSDHPLSPASQRISVDVNGPNPQEAARLNREQAAQAAADEQRLKQSRQEAEDQQKKTAQETAQQQRCNAARNRYGYFASGGRLTHADADGNRVFYTDQEIEEQRSLTKAAMDTACNF